MRRRSDRALSKQVKGQPIKAATINGAIEEINRNRTTDNAVNQPLTNGRQAIGRFKVISDEGDYLTCYSYSGDTVTTSIINVAKPYLLRKTPFNGFSRNGISFSYTSNSARTADNGATEDQVIVPSYVEGDEILAVTNIIGSTGVRDTDDKLVLWDDLNRDGRAWAKLAV